LPYPAKGAADTILADDSAAPSVLYHFLTF